VTTLPGNIGLDLKTEAVLMPDKSLQNYQQLEFMRDGLSEQQAVTG
jgi:hypothetical protein